MEPLICFPDPPPPELHKALAASGYSFTPVNDEETARRLEPPEGWSGAVVSAVDSLDRALRIARALRSGDGRIEPLVIVVSEDQLVGLDEQRELFDDFARFASVGEELEVRLSLLFARSGRSRRDNVIVYGPLALNFETYQAVVAGRPLDLTYMEYELLRFLAANPGKVFTRETLLSRVWGYEYFGGARTVDVHIRRLRAKLGEENAHLIETVRSVGYRFGTARWSP